MEESVSNRLIEIFQELDDDTPPVPGYEKDKATDRFIVAARNLRKVPCSVDDPRWSAICLLELISSILWPGKTRTIFWCIHTDNYKDVERHCGGLLKISKSTMNWSWIVTWE